MQTKLAKLNRFNWVMALLHAGQGAAILLLSQDFKLPVTAAYLRFDESSRSLVAASKQLFELPLPWLIAGFLFLSALFHLIIAGPYRRRYEANLAKGINKARWVEYALSASTMMVAIAMLVGIYDLGSLAAIFGLVAIMNLCGLIMEVANQGKPRPNWLSFWVGCLAGAIPWLLVGLYFWVSASQGAQPPTFVYWIFVSIFAVFNCFALNMVLQYKKVGKWRDYLYGERAYVILSLVAKSALAWQVFAGTLRP